MDRAARTGVARELFDLLNTSGRVATDLLSCPELVRVVEIALPGGGYDVQETAWNLVQAAVRQPDLEHLDHKPLVAAKHLLALADYPDEVLVDCKETLEQIAKKGVRVGGRDPRTSSTLRRKIASKAGGYGNGDNGRSLSKSKPLYLREISEALVDAIEHLIDDGQLDDLAVRLVLEPQPTFAAPPTELPSKTRRPRRRRLGIGAAIVCTGLVAVVMLVVPGLIPKGHLASTSLVATKSIPHDPRFIGEAFWVPLTAPIESLPVAENYCYSESTDPSDPSRRLQAWLEKYGVPQYIPLYFTVRNVSSSAGLLGITHIVASGKSKPAKTPGFIFNCPTGGGGETDWAELKLDLTSHSEAKLVTSQPSDYFWYGLESGQNFGIRLDLSGEEDFSGVISASAAPAGGAQSTFKLPVPSAGQLVHWRGIPADKALTVEPGYDGQSFECSYPNGSGASCDVAMIRAFLDKAWATGQAK